MPETTYRLSGMWSLPIEGTDVEDGMEPCIIDICLGTSGFQLKFIYKIKQLVRVYPDCIWLYLVTPILKRSFNIEKAGLLLKKKNTS